MLRIPSADGGRPWLAVTSAGTHGQDGLPMHPLVARLLAGIGADPTGFASSRLTAAMVAADDLVLTADLAHRDAVIALCPAASRRTFLIGEFARLLQHPQVHTGAYAPPTAAAPAGAAEPAAVARAVVMAAARYRGRTRWYEPALDAIADPDGGESAFGACAAAIDRAVTPIVAALAGPPPTTAPHRMPAANPSKDISRA